MENNTNCQIILNNEEHTLGNLIRDKLLQNNDVIFAAYKVPHPLYKTLEITFETLNTPCKIILENSINSILNELDTFETLFKKEFIIKK
jgi:DNA-directed RNA polymerase subunit L